VLYVLGVTRVNGYRVNMYGLKELRVRVYWIRVILGKRLYVIYGMKVITNLRVGC
jgi:hypothetical protein